MYNIIVKYDVQSLWFMHMWSIDYQYKNCNPEFDTGEKEMIKYYAQNKASTTH